MSDLWAFWLVRWDEKKDQIFSYYGEAEDSGSYDQSRVLEKKKKSGGDSATFCCVMRRNRRIQSQDTWVISLRTITKVIPWLVKRK